MTHAHDEPTASVAETALDDAADSKDQPACADEPLSTRIEALLLSTDRPLTDERLGELLGIAGKGAVAMIRAAVEQLNAQYDQTGRSFRAERLAGGWQLLTRPAFAPLLARLHRQRQESRLSPAALETLAIIAYRSSEGGIMRAEIEAIRGVACGEVLRGLLERRLIRIVGRAEQLGRPMLYGTTTHFLKVFGLPGTDALPPIDGASGESSVTHSS